jgi:hypothetical protein
MRAVAVPSQPREPTDGRPARAASQPPLDSSTTATTSSPPTDAATVRFSSARESSSVAATRRRVLLDAAAAMTCAGCAPPVGRVGCASLRWMPYISPSPSFPSPKRSTLARRSGRHACATRRVSRRRGPPVAAGSGRGRRRRCARPRRLARADGSVGPTDGRIGRRSRRHARSVVTVDAAPGSEVRSFIYAIHAGMARCGVICTRRIMLLTKAGRLPDSASGIRRDVAPGQIISRRRLHRIRRRSRRRERGRKLRKRKGAHDRRLAPSSRRTIAIYTWMGEQAKGDRRRDCRRSPNETLHLAMRQRTGPVARGEIPG